MVTASANGKASNLTLVGRRVRANWDALDNEQEMKILNGSNVLQIELVRWNRDLLLAMQMTMELDLKDLE